MLKVKLTLKTIDRCELVYSLSILAVLTYMNLCIDLLFSVHLLNTEIEKKEDPTTYNQLTV